MEKKIKIRKIIDDSFWDEFVSNSDHGTVFSSSAWLKAMASAQGGEPAMLGVWEGDSLIAGVSFIEVIRGSLKKANTHILIPYGGFIYRNEPDQLQQDTSSLQLICAEKLINYLEQKYNYVFLAHSPDFMDIRPFSWQNWSQAVRYTYLVDITDPEKLWDRFRRRAQRKILKAKDTLEIGGSVGAEKVTELYEQVFNENENSMPIPREKVISMLNSLIKSGVVEVNSVIENGKTISVQVLAFDKKTVYTWIAGTIPEKDYTGADSLLIWNAIKRYSSTHKVLDMVGANVPSIAFFKKGFGGTLTPYYVTERYSSTAAKTAFNTYSKIKGFFSR
ncbi:GNAT family N-acetyltransferase [Candidatus Latescibacterota bacterium]